MTLNYKRIKSRWWEHIENKLTKNNCKKKKKMTLAIKIFNYSTVDDFINVKLADDFV